MPTQERSRQRVEDILDAAAIEFGEVGFEAATTESIARRAGASIGSFYLFFPNKLSLFEALAERCLARTRAVFELLFPADAAGGDWSELLDAMVDGFAALHRTDPSFRAMVVNFQLYGLYAKADTALHEYIVGKVASKLSGPLPRLARRERRLMASTIVNTLASFLFLSGRAKAVQQRGLLQEAKRMVRHYVEGRAKDA